MSFAGIGVGRLSSLSLMLSGLTGVVGPEKFADALKLEPTNSRGLTETRAGLGGGYAALGAWAFALDNRTARAAVGAAWLGAGAGRLAGMQLDEPETDGVFWLSLAMELGLGLASMVAAVRD